MPCWHSSGLRAWPGLVYGEHEFDIRKLQGTLDLIYKAKDRYITAAAVSDSEWGGMCRALKREDWLDDARFKTSAARVSNAQERKALTAEEIKKWDSKDILPRFQAEGVPCAPLLDRMELMGHEQILANDSIWRSTYDGFGEVRQARPAARFDQTPSAIARPAPKLGEHGREILSALGYDAAAQQQLIDTGIVVVPDKEQQKGEK